MNPCHTWRLYCSSLKILVELGNSQNKLPHPCTKRIFAIQEVHKCYFFFGKLTYVLKEEETKSIRGIPHIYNVNRNIKQQMAISQPSKQKLRPNQTCQGHQYNQLNIKLRVYLLTLTSQKEVNNRIRITCSDLYCKSFSNMDSPENVPQDRQTPLESFGKVSARSNGWI